VPALDTTAKAALERSIIVPAYFIWLDIGTDDLRITTYGQDVTFSGTGDTDLDGNTFVAFGGPWIDLSEISNTEGGSETLTITLSGIVSMDTTILNDIGDKTLWQGRTCRVWTQLYDETGTAKQGAIVPLYTGYMSAVSVKASPTEQAIILSVENYLAFFSAASNRSYLGQKDYDAADTSAAATLACANGLRRDTGALGGGGPGNGFGGATGHGIRGFIGGGMDRL
jgi:hypothetical protein